MKKQTDNTEAKTAHGKTLDPPIKYEWSWTDYDSIDEVKAAGDMLSDDEVLKVRNTERATKARGKALTTALLKAGIVKPTAETDPQIALRDMVKTLLTAKDPVTGERKFTEETARAVAESTYGIKFEG